MRDVSGLVQGLKVVLADHYLMMIKYHNYHRNVTGSGFFTLHKFFEKQYGRLFERVDEIAEFIRQYRSHAPATTKEFLSLSDVKEFAGDIQAKEMIEDLIQSHTYVVKAIENSIKQCDELHDEATHDMLNEMMKFHRKSLWMLESYNK